MSEDTEGLEPEWRAEVCYTEEDHVDGDYLRWRHLAEWEAIYEPKPRKDDELGEMGDGSSSTKKDDGVAKPLSLAAQGSEGSVDRNALLDKLREEMEIKMTDILLEVLSQVLALAETAARSYDDHSHPSEEENNEEDKTGELSIGSTLPRILNNLDAVTLTYRFERHDPTKFTYLRHLASNQTSDVVQLYLNAFDESETATNSAERIFELQRSAREFVDANSERAKEIVVGLLDERVTRAADEALDGAMAVTKEKLDEAGKRLDDAGVGMGGEEEGGGTTRDLRPDAVHDDEGAKEKKDSSKHTDATNAEHMAKFRHAVAGGTEKLKDLVSKKGSEAKAVLSSDEELSEYVVKTLGGLIRKIMTRGVNSLMVSSLGALDGLIEAMAEAHEARKARAASDDVDEEKEMREETYRFVESVHDDLVRRAVKDTGIAVKVMGKVMSDKQLVALVDSLT